MLTEIYGELLFKEAKENKKIIVIDCDLGKSFYTAKFKKAYSFQYYNLGIAEQNAMCIAAGMAALPYNLVPFVNTFALFAVLRAGDQIRNSICYTEMNVKIVTTKIGFSDPQGGATHQAIEDVGIVLSIPKLVVLSPCIEEDVKKAFQFCLNYKGPVYLRLGKGDINLIPKYRNGVKYSIYRYGIDYAIFATTDTVKIAVNVSDYFHEKGITIAVIGLVMYKPLCEQDIINLSKDKKKVFILELQNVLTGVGNELAKIINKNTKSSVEIIGIKDCFTESGTSEELYNKYGITEKNLIKKINEEEI